MATNRIGIAIGNIIGMGTHSRTKVKPPLDPAIADNLKMVCIARGKEDDDPDADTVKDLTGNGNDLVISNFGVYGTQYDSKYEVLNLRNTEALSSTKTVAEIIGDTNEITVLSMIQIDDANDQQTNIRTNTIMTSNGDTGMYIETPSNKEYVKGIYGYSSSDIAGGYKLARVIMGDKKIYEAFNSETDLNQKLCVNGQFGEGDVLQYSTDIEWYWTIVANRVLTEDEINAVIDYYDLDSPVIPTYYYNVSKSAIENDNHAEYNDEMPNIAQHSNGYPKLKLYDFDWTSTSGIDDTKLCFSGESSNYAAVDDYLSLDDYTIIAKIFQDGPLNNACFLSKLNDEGIGAFHTVAGDMVSSFGAITRVTPTEDTEYTYRQSKYMYDKDTAITAGTTEDVSSKVLIGRLHPMISSRFNGYMKWVLVYPYSLSQFLQSRQIKRLSLVE